jgi:hypothetical protein
MENALPWIRRLSLARCRELAWPKEHGSWSLALEPLALGLFAAPFPRRLLFQTLNQLS